MILKIPFFSELLMEISCWKCYKYINFIYYLGLKCSSSLPAFSNIQWRSEVKSAAYKTIYSQSLRRMFADPRKYKKTKFDMNINKRASRKYQLTLIPPTRIYLKWEILNWKRNENRDRDKMAKCNNGIRSLLLMNFACSRKYFDDLQWTLRFVKFHFQVQKIISQFCCIRVGRLNIY